MREIFIITARQDGFKSKEGNWYKGTYLHGKIESVFEYDIFCFDRKINLDEGIHQFVLNGQDVSFFLWKNREPNVVHPWRGYLVYSKDEEAYDFALKQYRRREEVFSI